MTTAVDTCPGCASAIRAARASGGGIAVCSWCHETVHAQALPDPLEPPASRPAPVVAIVVAITLPQGLGPLDARKDMASRARWLWRLEGRAFDPDRDRAGSEEQDEPELERVQREHRREMDLARAARGTERLAAMHEHPDGARMARVVWYAHGQRGEELNQRESCAEQIAIRFAIRGEVAAHRRGTKWSDGFARIAFGNALLARAVAAYEHDTWEAPTKPQRGRDYFVIALAERWSRAKARWLSKEST